MLQEVGWHGSLDSRFTIAASLLDLLSTSEQFDGHSVVKCLSVALELVSEGCRDSVVDDEKIDCSVGSRVQPADIGATLLVPFQFLSVLALRLEPVVGCVHHLRLEE